MRNILLFVVFAIAGCWAVPKPMESVANYNILMVHGAYGSDKGIENCSDETPEAVNANVYLTTNEEGANIGYYHKQGRLTSWLESLVFEDSTVYDSINPFAQGTPYIYSWRAFTNPANSSINNARELGDRTWKGCGQRRALAEEAQEVKASWYDVKKDSTYIGQFALEIIRQNPDLYRQLASRYILIGHSMGGIASREWIQNSDYYYGDVDKVITLDSPHEGTGALNMQLNLKDVSRAALEGLGTLGFTVGLTAVTMGKDLAWYYTGVVGMAVSMGIAGGNLAIGSAVASGLEHYHETDSLVCYVDPHGKERDECKHVGNISDLKALDSLPDSLPMFRMLAGKHSMTFTDPKLGARNVLSFIVPDALTVPFANLYEQVSGGGDERVDYINSVTGFLMGMVSGANVQAHGSSLVETNNGLAYDTDIFTKYNVDLKRETFNAAAYAKDSTRSHTATILTDVGIALLGVDLLFNFFVPGTAPLVKAGIGVAAAASLATAVGFDVATGVSDLMDSHQMPLYKKNQETWHADYSNTVSPIAGSSVNDTIINPLVMEDFLYERPFVNLALNDTATLNQLQGMSSANREISTLNRNCYYIDSKDGVNCALGLFKSPNDLTSTHKNQALSGLTTPLRFKSESDWSKMGVKVDRWEKVDGLTPEGKDASNYVPIRHVERYEVPAITVEDWINKYSFVVDDLMPHRLRQIRMNFNYQEEIAWECDITKAEDDDKACKVYQRSAGEPWGEPKKTVRHPVKKNGLFDFIPDDYGITNKLAIQKDNQNTVTISTVNKIGLSNTQRFYYMYKATEDLLESDWPTRDVVLNSVEGFEAHASVLNYQGFSVDSAYDVVYKGDDIEHGTRLKMKGTPNGVQDMDFESHQQMDALSDGEYAWQFRAYATNNATGDLDTSKFYNALFSIDRVAPKFSLYTDNGFVNPDSANFVVRYRWNGGDSVTPDIRAMRWTLEKGCSLPNDTATAAEANCSGSINLPAMYDVAARDFAVSWDKVPVDARKNLADGHYRIKAYALDYAVPNRLMYDSVNALIGRIMDSPNSLTDADWKLVRDSSARLNDTTVYAMFRIDRTAPVISDIVPKSVYAVDTIGKSYA